MNVQSRKKLDSILELIRQGTTKKDIVHKKFSRSRKGMTDWLNKISDELTDEEKELLSFTKGQVSVVKNNKDGLPVQALTMIENHDKTLKIYDERLKALEYLLQDQENVVTSDVLIINDEILRSKPVVRSFRVCPNIISEFNELADNNLNFTKTNLINQALREFVDKYK